MNEELKKKLEELTHKIYLDGYFDGETCKPSDLSEHEKFVSDALKIFEEDKLMKLIETLTKLNQDALARIKELEDQLSTALENHLLAVKQTERFATYIKKLEDELKGWERIRTELKKVLVDSKITLSKPPKEE